MVIILLDVSVCGLVDGNQCFGGKTDSSFMVLGYTERGRKRHGYKKRGDRMRCPERTNGNKDNSGNNL
jgi:hypothetical protein